MTNKPDPKAVEAGTTSTDEEMRRQIEDIIVDTSLHPVDASLRVMRLIKSSNQALLERIREEGPKDSVVNQGPLGSPVGDDDWVTVGYNSANKDWQYLIDSIAKEIQKELS